jgi:indolepyruvate ferredoxin oxidoreductase alpha subunit
VNLVRALASRVDRILVLEDGAPHVERLLCGLLPPTVRVGGRMSGEVPATGELTPDLVRAALGLRARPTLALDDFRIPARPPQLCQGCPHGHAFHALQRAVEQMGAVTVTSDIGCYTLGALPPYSVIESCVCMGASIGMARGAADTGLVPAVAVIGDSTFLHSGITPLMDAVATGADITVLILDNQAVGMTGAQDPIVPSDRLQAIVLAVGVPPERCHVIDPHPRRVASNAEILRREIQHPGVSVVIARRECKEVFRRRQREAGESERSRAGATASLEEIGA